MTDRSSLPLWHATATPRNLLLAAVLAIAFALFFLFVQPERPVTRRAFVTPWVFISLVASSAYHVSRGHEKRIQALEEALTVRKEER